MLMMITAITADARAYLLFSQCCRSVSSISVRLLYIIYRRETANDSQSLASRRKTKCTQEVGRGGNT